jgi:hypothetical protein
VLADQAGIGVARRSGGANLLDDELSGGPDVKGVRRHLAGAAGLLWRFVRGPDAAAKTDWLKRLTDVGTLPVLVVGLFFAYDQANKLTASIDSAAWYNVTNQEFALDKLFIDNPSTRKYFYDDVAIQRGDPLYDSVAATAEYMLDFIDTYFSSAQYMQPDTSDPDLWRHYFTHIFSNSPITCEILDARSDEYGDDINNLAKEPCARKGSR